jgi:hypothetical protein
MMVLVHDVWDEGPHVCGETQLVLLEFFDTCVHKRGIGGSGENMRVRGCVT